MGRSYLPAAPPLDDGPQPQEPVLKSGTIGTAAASVMTLLVVFSVPLNKAQQVAILGVIASVLPLVMAFIHRRRVFSPESVRLLMRSERDKHTGEGGHR